MGRKFAFEVATTIFNQIVIHETYREKYDQYSQGYRHNVRTKTSRVFFGPDAPEKEIMDFVLSFGESRMIDDPKPQ